MQHVILVGVGDVCAFAEMNPRRNGHPEVSHSSYMIIIHCSHYYYKWQSSQLTQAQKNEQGEYGKVELSLIQFSVSMINF